VSAKQDDLGPRLERVLVRRIDGCRRLISVERLSGGASQETHRILIETEAGERKLAMRRAPGGVSSDGSSLGGSVGLRGEARLINSARAAGVPVPEIYHVLEPEDALGDGFVMQWLDGETLGPRILRSEALADVRPRLAYQCGQLLARIHGIDLEASGLSDQLDQIEPAAFVRRMWEGYQALDTPQPMIDFTACWLEDHLPPFSRRTLVHNDFRNGNLMVSPEGIVAVLDWEVAHIGDPMRDLGWVCTNSWRFGRTELPVGGFGEYADLFRGYEEESGQKVDPDHVKFWEVFGSFWWAVACLGMALHFRSGPDKTVERPAIGRRTSECQVDCVNLLIPGPVERIPPAPFDAKLDMPRIDELVESVRDYLREDVMACTEGRTRFLARVAGNSLDIALRELAVGPEHRRRERERLAALLSRDGELETLRRELCARLRDRSMPLDEPGLAEHLRASVVNQIAIDQPKYSGLETALRAGG
jgi:aminoglycoside phosphotransferase (APT) family kinase protein